MIIESFAVLEWLMSWGINPSAQLFATILFPAIVFNPLVRRVNISPPCSEAILDVISLLCPARN